MNSGLLGRFLYKAKLPDLDDYIVSVEESSCL